MPKPETVRSLIGQVHKSLPAFNRRARLLFATPVQYLLRGICFDSSSYSKQRFYPTVFVQPLYLPKDYIFFTYGGRLSGFQGFGWDLIPGQEEQVFEDVLHSIREEALPFLEFFHNPIDLAVANEHFPPELPTEFHWTTSDINVLETMAYSWFLSGDLRKSLACIREIQLHQTKDPDNRAWVLDLILRVKRFETLIEGGAEAEANQLLNKWTRDCASSLGLIDFLKL